MPMKVLLFLIEGRKVHGLCAAGCLKCTAGSQMCVARLFDVFSVF